MHNAGGLLLLRGDESVRLHVQPTGLFTPSVSHCGVRSVAIRKDVHTENPDWLFFQGSGMRRVTALFLIRRTAHHE